MHPQRRFILVACALAAVPMAAAAAEPGAAPQEKVEPPTLAPMPAAPVIDQVDPNLVTPATYGPASFKDTASEPLKPTVDPKQDEPTACFDHAQYLRGHHDLILAAAYLKQIATNSSLPEQTRARAIIQLADVLADKGEEAQALCWLKIWCELYPGRREFAAVAYRVATYYREMGMPDLARDAYYLALAHAVNQGQMVEKGDLASYNQLTTATLWGLAANEYQAGKWDRAAELFDRYRREATAATPMSMEKSEYLQADCYYQLQHADDAIKLYSDTLTQHPFNPLAPQARLRLYHLYITKNQPAKAQAELEALIWTVRTVWPMDEPFWQHQTAQLLLAINQKNTEVLPPLVKGSALLPPQGKTWQDTINHYDALVSYQVAKSGAGTDRQSGAFSKIGDKNSLEEEHDLLVMNNQLNQVLPQVEPTATGANP
jgi:outer membrane protein assembly factor BamD (BamD/ComL family)